jgi:hypothetical protein
VDKAAAALSVVALAVASILAVIGLDDKPAAAKLSWDTYGRTVWNVDALGFQPDHAILEVLADVGAGVTRGRVDSREAGLCGQRCSGVPG